MGTRALYSQLSGTSAAQLYHTGLVCIVSLLWSLVILLYNISVYEDVEHLRGNLITMKMHMSDVHMLTQIFFAQSAKWECCMTTMASSEI